MAALELSPGAVASLCEKELEILGLLATGHTAKSIAAQLGCTETAVHERLREARRKTGVGSSRELARQLAAQKIWDRNMALHTDGFPADSSARPAKEGRRRFQGAILMLFSLPLAAAALALPAAIMTDSPAPGAVSQSALVEASPLAGEWALDTDRIPAEERPQAVTIVFDVSDAGEWTIRVAITAADGTVTEARSTATLDGVAVPVTGTMAFIDSVSLRQPALDTLVMTLGKDGAPVSTRVYTVTQDRNSMTETIIWPGNDIPGLETTYFTRVG